MAPGITLLTRALRVLGQCWLPCKICRQVCFVVNFFVIEAPSQNSTALGYAVLYVPEDVQPSDGVAELSADVTAADGTPLEGVVCVVDLKVT